MPQGCSGAVTKHAVDDAMMAAYLTPLKRTSGSDCGHRVDCLQKAPHSRNVKTNFRVSNQSVMIAGSSYLLTIPKGSSCIEYESGSLTCKFRPIPGRSLNTSMPNSLRWSAPPMPLSWSSCGVWTAPAHISTSPPGLSSAEKHRNSSTVVACGHT